MAYILGPNDTGTAGAIGNGGTPYYSTAGYTGASSGSITALQINITDWIDVTGLKIAMYSADGTQQRVATFTPADGTGVISKAVTAYAYTASTIVRFVIYTTGGGGLVSSFRQGSPFLSSYPATGSYASPAATINPVTDTSEQVPHGFYVVADGTVGGGSSTTATPTTGLLSIQGQQHSVNPFTNVRIREVFINEAGSPLANMTGMSLLIWYAGSPIGSPDLSYSAVTTDTNGTMSYSLATGSLVYNQPIFYLATDGHASLSAWTCARMTPTYT